MRHHVHPDFPIEGLSTGVILCRSLYTLVKAKNFLLRSIPLSSLTYNNLSIINITDVRYKAANINLPGLVTQTPGCGDTFRLLDGRHRVKKAMDLDMVELPFYVVPLSDALKYYYPD